MGNLVFDQILKIKKYRKTIKIPLKKLKPESRGFFIFS
jgi:hypothetical protein